jgi:hypothetical protein
MRPLPRPNLSLVRAPQLCGVRLRPVVHLIGGDSLGMAADEASEFEDLARFTAQGFEAAIESPATWLAQRLERVTSAAIAEGQMARPVLVTAPMTSLADANTAAACDAAVRRTVMCQQEFCLMYADAALSGDPADAAPRLARLRRAGFRIGIDMRRSWQTPLAESIRVLIDTIVVDADQIDTSAALHDVLMVARASGILVAAENASWRDGEALDRLGIAGAIAPRADA